MGMHLKLASIACIPSFCFSFCVCCVETLVSEGCSSSRIRRWCQPKSRRSWASKRRWRCLLWRQVKTRLPGTKWRFPELNVRLTTSVPPPHPTTTLPPAITTELQAINMPVYLRAHPSLRLFWLTCTSQENRY